MGITNNSEEKYLYKYLPFNQYSLQLLINQKFYLSAPNLLNDPFEGDFIISNYSNLYNEKTFNFLINKREIDSNAWINNHNKETTLKNWRLNERDFELYLYEFLNKSIRSKFGTTSFSKECNSIDMWSHYADSHNGFVLIFDRDLLADQYEILNFIIDVDYDTIPNVEVNPEDLTIDNDNILLKNKLPEWSKEKEVRIIKKYWLDKGYENEYSRLLEFPPESIIGVIYGLNMSIENLLTIDHLLLQLKSKEIKTYYAKKNHKRDKIIFKEFE